MYLGDEQSCRAGDACQLTETFDHDHATPGNMTGAEAARGSVETCDWLILKALFAAPELHSA